MSSSIQLLNLISSMNKIGSKSSSSYSSLSSLGGLTGSCSCNSGLESTSASNSSAFNIMLTSLLNAISEKNKMAKSESEKVSLEDIFSTYNNSNILVYKQSDSNVVFYVDDKGRMTSCGKFGKTVFLTREDAERALKGGEE